MSEQEATQVEEQAAATQDGEQNLLELAISATKQTERTQAEELLKNLTEQALKGTVKWDKNLLVSINSAIKSIDDMISKQLSAVMHAHEFTRLEGSWRGLHHFVMNSETGSGLKIKVLNVKKKEVSKDLEKAVEFDQSQLFKTIYESEFGTPGGEPYGALIGDYYFSNHPEDVELATNLSHVAAAAFCPFISASDPKLFGFESWTELSKPRDLEKIFEGADYAKWRGFRDSEDSRFFNLVMPNVLGRLPYGNQTKPIDEFDFEETPLDSSGNSTQLSHENYCWMNAAYIMGTQLTNAFSKYGWCTSIRGAEGGGKVTGLAMHTFTSDDGDIDMQCPTEIGITDRREAELSKLGFLPLCHYKNTDYAVFFGAQSTQKPKEYDRPNATANAAISARLPYIMASSRFAHYLKIMGRDKIGSFMECSDVEAWLNRWILNYVNGNADSGQEMKAKYPLAEAKISVSEVPGKPGSYNAIAHLSPWLQMEELTTSLRLVAKIPELG